jgi:WD40 repeat protein/serine/threonine protein kinase
MSFSAPTDSDALEALMGQVLDEYAEQLARGVQPSVEEYASRYPQLGGVLRLTLPALEAVRRSSAVESPQRAEESSDVGTPDAERRLGEFRINREIGRGGMGIVYEAIQTSLGRRVALKVLPFATAMDSKQLQRFKTEAQAAAQLHHTNIVPVYAVGCERGVHYYAMQYIEGHTVAALIRELRRLAGLEPADPSASVAPASSLASELASGRWAPAKPKGGELVRSFGREQPTGPYLIAPPHDRATAPAADATPPVAALPTERSGSSPAFFRTVAHLGVQAAEALEHAHGKAIIHRDIKPANLLLDLESNLWITDFGLARILSEAGLTMTGDLVGTLRYMSPEQALAKRVPVDHRTDIYSLGVTLYELLTLRPACDGCDRQEILQQIAFEEPRLPRRLNKAIPAELEIIVRKAMGKTPAERYATAQELADDLRRFLDDKPIRAKRPTLLDWTRKWIRRHQGVVATGIAGLVLAVGILAVSTLLILSSYKEAVTNLYKSYVREAKTVRQARAQGYRSEAWQLLQQALALQTPEKDVRHLRQEAVACLGDFVGLEPITWNDFSEDINVIALDPKGVQLAIGLSNGSVWLRDLDTGTIRARLQQHHGPVTGLAFAPDGLRLVSADSEGKVQVWEANAHSEWILARTITAEPAVFGLIPSAVFPFFVPQFVSSTIKAIAITPDGKQLCACVNSPHLPTTVALWNLADGTRTPRAFTVPGSEHCDVLALSPEGKFLAASYVRNQWQNESYGVLVWSRDTGELEQDLSPEVPYIDALGFSPDGEFLACGGAGVALFKTSTFQRYQFARGEAAHSFAFIPSSPLLAIANACLGRVRLWDFVNNHSVAALQQVSDPGEDCHFSVLYSRDRHTLVGASRRIVRAWNLAGSDERLVLAGHRESTQGLAFSPDGKLLASAGDDQVVNIWDPTTGQLLKKLSDFHAGPSAPAFSADGKTLITDHGVGAIEIWDVATWQKLFAITDAELGRQTIQAVALSPNGRYMAAGSSWSKGGIWLWGIKPRGINHNADGHLQIEPIARLANGRSVWSVVFSPDDQLLAWVEAEEYTSRSNTLHLWELANARERSLPPVRLKGHIQSIAFHPNGKQLFFIADTGLAEAWDVRTGQRKFSFGASESEQRNGITSLGGQIALSSDGAWLASINGTFVSVWDTASGQLLLKLREEQSTIMSLAWSLKGDLLAVGTLDGGLVIWDLPKIKAQLDAIGLGW